MAAIIQPVRPPRRGARAPGRIAVAVLSRPYGEDGQAEPVGTVALVASFRRGSVQAVGVVRSQAAVSTGRWPSTGGALAISSS
jgi:hypothetical protein